MWAQKWHREAARYGVAVLSVTASFVIALAIEATIPGLHELRLLLALVAVIFSGWRGGREPGLVATFLSCALSTFNVVPPAHAVFGSSSVITISLFLMAGVSFSVFAGAFRKTVARNAALLATAPDAVVVMDSIGKIVEFNLAAEEMFGRSESSVIGQEMASVLIPERMRNSQRKGLQRYLKTGVGEIVGQKTDASALRCDGTEFPVEIVISRIISDGPPVFIGFVRDMSPHKEMEERLKYESQVTRLNQQIKSISDPSVPFDDVMQSCLGLVCETAGFSVGHIYWPDDGGMRLVSSKLWFMTDSTAFESFRKATEAFTMLSRGEGLPGRIWKSGKPALIENIERDDNFPQNKSPASLGIKGALGIPILIGDEILAVMEFYTPEELTPNAELLRLTRNVGEQMGRVIERRRSLEGQARLAAIVDSSYDPIVGKSLDGVITSWNRAAEQVYGFSVAEAVGQSISIVLPPDDPEIKAEVLAGLRSGQRLEQFETIRRHRDGHLIPVSLTLSPVRDSAGRLIGYSAIERDISLIKKTEQELREAKDAAEAANRAKSDFLANVSHELRTPMNAILGMLQLALGEDLSPVMRDYLGTAKDSADSLMFLLNDILDFSRMEVGRFKLELAPFRLRETLDEASKTLSLRAHEKGLELTCHIDKKTPEFLIGDQRRLRQVVLNLVGNAIKFTELGEIAIEVFVEPSWPELDDIAPDADTDGTSVLRSRGEQSVPGEECNQSGDMAILHLTVSDTGIGIPSVDQATIFAPFTQVDPSTTRKQAGTGLGLAICRELIELMGGRIWVESQLGQGSQFHCTAKFEIAQTATADSHAASLIAELKGTRILIVDDNRTNQRVLDSMLTNWGMRPTTVSDADTALILLQSAKAKSQPFRLILIDALMPGKDGFQLASELLNVRPLFGAIILMLSSADRQVFSDRLKGLEIAAFLEKPVSQLDLLTSIKRALHGSRWEIPTLDDQDLINRPLRVLVAEDTPANQKLIRAILSQRGHHITVVQNGREAVELVKHETFDVVLMDVQMPTMDGIQATAAIRKLEQSSQVHLPIIAMTAHAFKSDQERFLAAGMDDCLTKPVDAWKVIDKVEWFGEPFVTSARMNPRTGEPNHTFDSVSRRNNGATEQPTISPIPNLNLELTLQRLGGDKKLLQKLVQSFLEDVPTLLENLRTGHRDNDFEGLVRAAHSLRGLSANFNANVAIESAARVEKMGLSQNLSNAASAIEEVETVFQDLCRTLNSIAI